MPPSAEGVASCPSTAITASSAAAPTLPPPPAAAIDARNLPRRRPPHPQMQPPPPLVNHRGAAGCLPARSRRGFAGLFLHRQRG
uniref:Uncharacterized protein n=1 Tax=Oryza rufipogon TaxID=4529 RepID=A0A0E0NKL5_ORYRU